jgi:hypothetical protein
MFWVANNTEPIKLTVYLSPLVFILLFVWSQRQEAIREQMIAEARATIAIDALLVDQVADAAQNEDTQVAIRTRMKGPALLSKCPTMLFFRLVGFCIVDPDRRF